MDFTAVITEYRQAGKNRGVVAEVARRLGLSHEHVRQVALGTRASKRVARALVSERKRRDREEQKGRAA